MRLKAKNDRINLPLKVLGPVKNGDHTGVKGINLLDGKEVEVFLTTMGKSAENGKRPSIETLFSGLETEGTVRELKPGGIICMNGAFKLQDGSTLAQWPMVVRWDEQDTVMLCEHGTLIGGDPGNGKPIADFYSFHPEQSIKGAKAGVTLKQALARNAEQTNRPAYLIRVVEGKKVLDYEIHQAVYDRDEQKPMSAEQIADSVVLTAQQLLDRHPGKKLDILPASRFFIPARNLEKRKNYFDKLQPFFSQNIENGDREFFSRKAVIKCGGNNDQYCNMINVIEPYSPGTDPVLIGGYSHEQDPGEQEADSPRAACRP